MREPATVGMQVGRAFADAIADLDYPRLESLFRPDVRFRALIPRACPEGSTAAEAVREIHRWFADTDRVVLVDSSVGAVVDRLHVAWRLRVREGGAWYELEQHAFATVEEGRIVDIALICSGFRPDGDPTGDAAERTAVTTRIPDANRRLDAVGESCATLTPTVRSAIRELAPGQVLEVIADDPAAPDGIASWSRLTGHELLATRPGAGTATHFYLRRS